MSESSSITSLGNLKLLYGELKDGEDSQTRFRGFLMKENWGAEQYEKWLHECKSESFSKEFQDIIVVLGRRLGFEPEFGQYAGSQEKVAFDGLWKSSKGQIIVIEAKLGTWIAHDVSQLGSYIDRVANDRNIPSDKIFGLYVVGGSSGLGALASQVRGSRYLDKIRILTSEDLLKLLRFHEELGLTHDQLARLLIPIDAVNVGELIQLIEAIVYEQKTRIETPAPSVDLPSLVTPPLGSVARSTIQGLADGDVIICPSGPGGIKFLQNYNAWGFVRVGREPKYFALYVSQPTSAVKYFAEVEKIIDPTSLESPIRNPQAYQSYSPGKLLIVLKRGSLKELKDPIPRGSKITQGLFYTTLEKLLSAKSLDDV